MIEILNRLKEFKEEDYGNYPENISEKCYNLAIKLLNHIVYKDFEAFITYNKTVQFEFDYNGYYIEIEISDDKFSVWGNDSILNDLYQVGDNGIEFPEEDMYEVINIIKMFVKGRPEYPVLFTGAFNPPTIAHYHMIDSVLSNESYDFDYVIFAISNQKFLDKKQNKTGDYAYSEQERIDMLLEMTWANEDVLIFGVEQGYTYNVLCAVKEKYKTNSVFFAMGSDKLQEIHRWGYHDKLLVEFCFYVLMRGTDSKEEVIQKCNDLFADTKYVIGEDNQNFKDISATMVRAAIRNHTEFKDLVHPDVYKYLSEK